MSRKPLASKLIISTEQQNVGVTAASGRFEVDMLQVCETRCKDR